MITLKKGATQRHMQKLTLTLSERRKLSKKSIKDYCGSIKLKEDPIEIQKKMRNEWC